LSDAEIRSLIAEDENLSLRYSKQSLKRAKMFHISKIIKKWDDIINNI